MDAPLYTDLADIPEGGCAFWAITPDQMRLRFALWSGGTRGTVLIFPGRTEYIEKYGRVVARILEQGFSALVIDWRGQGLSTRPDGSTGLGHVDDFDAYQTDIETILSHDAAQNLHKPLFLLAHSMGGCIGLRALHRGVPIAAAVFSAPMWGIKLPPIIGPIIPTMACLLNRMGLGQRHVPGTDGRYYVTRQDFDGNELTTCAETYDWLRTHLAAHPDLGLGGPGIAWLDQACRETVALMRKPAPNLPIMTFLGGDETIVCSDVIQQFHAKPGSGSLVTCPGARHEILMETPEIQGEVWPRIMAFLDQSPR